MIIDSLESVYTKGYIDPKRNEMRPDEAESIYLN